MRGALRDGEDVPGASRVDEDGMVYKLADGSVRYFQDRGRKYPFTAGREALPLLRGLLATNVRVNQLSRERIEATGDIEATIRHGESLYVDKPTMKSSKGKGTWSDDEYAHPGLQAIYLRLKSFQRFTESWALYERAARCGALDRYLPPRDTADEGGATLAPLRVASLGGGPGYELLAFEWFLRFWAAVGRKPALEQKAWLLGAAFGTDEPSGGDAAAPPSAAPPSAAPPAAAEVTTASGVTAAATLAPLAAPPMAAAPDAQAPGTSAAPPLMKTLSAAPPLMKTLPGAPPPPPSLPPSGPPPERLPALHLVSLDLQPTWEPYVKALRGPDSSAEYSFAQWDVHAGVEALAASARADAACGGLELCVISNVLVYCTDEETADVLAALLTTHGVHAILINERGAEQKMVDMLTRRGVVVVRLLSQTAGRDDRQLLVLPPGQAPASLPAATAEDVQSQDGRSQDVRASARSPAEGGVFPNVPYEEAKYAAGGS